jgi:hypothetical protein
METILQYIIAGYSMFITSVGAALLFGYMNQRLKDQTNAIDLKLQSGKVFGDLDKSNILGENAKAQMDQLLAMRFPVGEHFELRPVLLFALQVRRANRGIYARSGLERGV